MSRSIRSLWPANVHAPYRRLALAMVLAPLIITIVLTFVAFVLAGMSETARDGVVEVTVKSGYAMLALTFGFTLTFGIAGIVVLGLLERRGRLAWTLAGIVSGAAAGLLFGSFAIGTVDGPALVAFCVAGWAIFLLIRRLAGIQDEPPIA